MTNLGYTADEPIAAIATPLSPGAIGIVRTSGKNCIDLVAKIFSRPKSLLSAQGNTLVYGWIVEPESESDSASNLQISEINSEKKIPRKKIDEVMLGVYRAPKSFTGEDMVEIYCHGGVAVVSAILNLLLKNGFRQAERGEYTFRSYINGKSDLTKAEAVREIIESKTDASRGRAAGRLSGSILEEISSVKKLIVETIAAIEVAVEYPEDEETISNSFDSRKLVEASRRLKLLAESWKSERLYQDGARVVLCGKTNAGKSSLFNALLKEERAIVSDVEGTTRDYLEAWAGFDGIPARLFDTAGLRETGDRIEAAGVQRTKDLSEEADLILYLVDSTRGFDSDDSNFISEQKIPAILVWTKTDRENSLSLSDCAQKNLFRECVELSSKTGSGMGKLSQTVKKVLMEKIGSQDSVSGLGSERQKKSVEEALERVNHSLIAADEGYALDAVVQDLEDSLDSLGEVTGEVTPDDILENIFSNFCVGK